MGTLPTTGHEHHDLIRTHIDRLPALADELERRPLPDDFAVRFSAELDFIEGTLLPHVAVVEASVYPELERLMQNRHSMAPMRREHAELTGLVGSIASYRDRVEGGNLGMSDAMGLRRAIYRLYALVKVHVAEEQEYLRVLQGSLSVDEQEALASGLEHARAHGM